MTELDGDIKKLTECLYDSMTECIYQHPITSFSVATKPQPVFEVDVLGKGRAALEKTNHDLGETLCPFSKCPFQTVQLQSLSLILISLFRLIMLNVV